MRSLKKNTPQSLKVPSADSSAEVTPPLDKDQPHFSLSKGKQRAFYQDSSQSPLLSSLASPPPPLDSELERELNSVDNTFSAIEEDLEKQGCDSDSDQSEYEVPEDQGVPPEKKIIGLPSNSDLDVLRENGSGFVLELEADLRMGDMNDTLEKLRVVLGTRSVLMKKTLRGTQGGSGKTRAWAEINKYTRERNLLVRYYLRSRQALQKLGTHPEPLESTYKPIKAIDLKVTEDIVEENRIVQHSDKLPWFWRLDKTELMEDSNVMQECRFMFMRI